jgi:uncharacterized membrane protein YgdD (TMEM256/DUF423 family)
MAFAALLGAAGVGLGAVSAHLVGSGQLAVASSFLLFHAPVIVVLGAPPRRSRLLKFAQLALLIGAVLFSGTLTFDSLLGWQLSPSPAPLGGVLLILGWLLAAAAFLT